MTTAARDLRLEEHDGGWRLAGPTAASFGLANDYLAYLDDRNSSPRTVRADGFDLLAFCRWLHGQGQTLEAVTTDVLLA
jgi:integrase/recombinase XerD